MCPIVVRYFVRVIISILKAMYVELASVGRIQKWHP